METSHINALQLKHADIEQKIQEEMQRPMPDDIVLHTLKKEKLRLKEAIVQMSAASLSCG